MRSALARLIEARAQEPILRVIRLTAIGEVERPADAELRSATTIEPIAYRRMWIGESWHDAAPAYSMSNALPGIAISGPAAITSPFTTVILGPDEVANVTATGDILIELPATARA